jgi:hypothetical protein
LPLFASVKALVPVRIGFCSAVAMSRPFLNEEGLPFPGGLQNFLFFAVRSESLPSRPHSRPLNKDDDDDADKKVALHFVVSERDQIGSRQVIPV